MGLSAVCAYNMTSVDEVFSKGKFMQKATVEQSHTKWVQYNGITPSPRPGAVRIPIYSSIAGVCDTTRVLYCHGNSIPFYRDVTEK